MTDENLPGPPPADGPKPFEPDPETKERILQYKTKLEELASCPEEVHEALFIRNKCPAPVELLKGVPLGMFHCEVCGSMVLAGAPHGDIDPPWDPARNRMAAAFYKEYPHLLTERRMHICIVISNKPFDVTAKTVDGYLKIPVAEIHEVGDMRYYAGS